MKPLPSLATLRAFECAARHSSFKAAAAELRVTPTAVSHRIRALEEVLGVELFERRTRQVVLTAEGHALYPTIRDAFESMAYALDSVRQRELRRVAVLSCTVAFAARRLVPHSGAFRDAHPGLVVEPLLVDRFAPVASPSLALRAVEQLRETTLVHFDWAKRADPRRPTWSLWAQRAGIAWLDTEAGLTFSDEAQAIQAALAGQGAALLSTTLVADELASGALVQPFGPELDGYRYDFVYPERRVLPAAVPVLRAWVLEALGLKSNAR
ncbi:MAG: LysR family transcriptional regulator [Kofleriaceae bacterium]|nr:LysR family transcriptional regulator [Kofleriaceae bacterium]